jgi:hypothetical protein
MAKRSMRAHLFRYNADLPADHKGQRYCADCPLGEHHDIHQPLPETTQAARDRDSAVLGEKADDE